MCHSRVQSITTVHEVILIQKIAKDYNMINRAEWKFLHNQIIERFFFLCGLAGGSYLMEIEIN